MFETLKTLLVCIKRYIEIIESYVEIVRLVSLHVSLHVVFRNLVALVVTSDKTMWGYREVQVSRKLEHGPRHYNALQLLDIDCIEANCLNFILLALVVVFKL